MTSSTSSASPKFIADFVDTLLTLSSETLKKASYPEALFPKDMQAPSIDQFKDALRKLRSKWHALATESTSNSDTFTHVCSLLESGVSRLEKGLWGRGNVRTFATKSETICFVSYDKIHVTPGLHTRLESRHLVHHLYPEHHRGLVKNLSVNFLADLGIADITWSPAKSGLDVRLRKEFETQLSIKPQLREVEEGLLVTFRKPEGFVNLGDLIAKRGPVPEIHVRWILSRAYNLACFMQVMGLYNLDLSPSSLYVHPVKHSLIAVDGWQYQSLKSPALTVITGRTLSVDPVLKDTKKATASTAGKLVKALGRELLGDLHGADLLRDKGIPGEVLKWLTSPVSGDVITDYSGWGKILDSLGRRQFVNWDVNTEGLYE